MRHTKLVIPCWKTGLVRRIHAIPVAQIRDAVVALIVIGGLAVLLVSPIVFAFLTPPMVD